MQEFNKLVNTNNDQLEIFFASKFLTFWKLGEWRQQKVVDSKIMTPAMERNSDEAKNSGRGVAALAARACRDKS